MSIFETDRVKIRRLEQFLLVMADRHVREKQVNRVPVFDEFDEPWQTSWVCAECGDSKSSYNKDKDCDRLKEIKEFLGV